MEEFNREDGRFDFNLDRKKINGELMELYSHNILTNPELKFEVKSENKWLWGRTQNVYVEYQQFKGGKWVDSGISITESDFWVIVLKDYNNKPISQITLSTQYLRDRIFKLIEDNLIIFTQKEKTSDGTATKGYLIHLLHLFITDDEYWMEQEKMKKERLKSLTKFDSSR
jgi:hypothetical protein